ncbi:biosynthetic peptidoglycan transglycosylase [Bailinhaonella thermotolerans]|uniref:biosynthetic peptidoglycan transglycosylase n=1 Tax=Bailinhaonella thermotolerans TaxID=1070861 RepID=UPI001F5B94F5|nr:biosynthetic peptidoglycan transglycosylase [Bailinhaonella thermotolerans]
MRFIVIAVVASVAIFGLLYTTTPIPDAPREPVSLSYGGDGHGARHHPVPLSRVPRKVRMAFIAAENRGFYDDPGVSVTGLARAAWSTLVRDDVQGGSTITQQMVRNYYPGIGLEQTVGRKLKEIIIALKVTEAQSKDWILETYLNSIYFGRGAYGIEAASQAYYKRHVQDLTTAQAAFLAAVVQRPNHFDRPYGARRPAAEARWRYVVDGMREIGALTPAEAAALRYPSPPRPSRTR